MESRDRPYITCMRHIGKWYVSRVQYFLLTPFHVSSETSGVSVFHTVSRPTKLQSLHIVGRDEIQACTEMLQRTPEAFRHTRFLFISIYAPRRWTHLYDAGIRS